MMRLSMTEFEISQYMKKGFCMSAPGKTGKNKLDNPAWTKTCRPVRYGRQNKALSNQWRT